MNGKYNRALTLTDFLYLSVAFIGLNVVLELSNIYIYIIVIVVTFSLIVDWTSAFTMSPNAGNVLLLSDLCTVLNYLCLYKSIKYLCFDNLDTYLRFSFHYLMVYIIYFIWNVLVLKKEKNATPKTKSFFIVFTILSIVCSLICINFIILKVFNLITLQVAQIYVFVNCGGHAIILASWVLNTFVNNK